MVGIKVFSGRANPELARKIGDYLGKPLGKIDASDFSDGEIGVQIQENVRGRDVFIIQPTCTPVNRHLMELLIMIDAFKRASADTITAVIPYYGYARQDRKVEPRVPITAKLVADLLTAAGANRIVTMDLHAGQIQGFFNVPVDHLFGSPVFLRYFRKKHIKNLIVISPDAGGVERARAYAKRLKAKVGFIDKRRVGKNLAKVAHIVGDVEGRTALIVDDMVDTAGTLVEGTNALLENGAFEVFACCTHPVLSGPAIERLCKSPLKEIVVTNTIPLGEKTKACPKLKVLSVAHLFGEAIRRIHDRSSVSSLFD
ncbi:MAG: ribose-phosphate pyrophosphokinase [Candidatus Tectomicrobia bacterium]|uniref:Ribose-phosphate pyrophosphokinase n=1 Tax=Tectimicrobiota bacterium TaxID=2528274 RepID=A0A932GQF1_UNCTE|nr:ribose-phosphate pyrophosphokinase [Candidatus Tectomicrobia bacterium]